MWEEIVVMFTTMQWYIYVPLILGVILMVVECFVPGFGVFGISGLGCIVGAIIAQGILYKSVAQILFLIFMSLFAILLIFLIFIRSATYGLLGKTPLVENKTAVPVDYNDNNKNELKSIMGKRGIVVSRLMPTGKFMIDDNLYEGTTNGESIDKDQIVKVINVQGNKIIVEKVEV